jgi:ABC-type transport system involved in Fe-S cluster assembly fused permease/ATPase subunit
MSLIPQVVIAPYCYDKGGAVICAEQYDFSPTEVLAEVSMEEYIVFAIHILEYKTLILEQMAEEQERSLSSLLSSLLS